MIAGTELISDDGMVAYLLLDEQGRFTEWTGLVTKA
jgi:hypothetical protein